MSSNPNDTITLSNYEEYFILYVDEELTASQKAAVEAFAGQHPLLAEELAMLLSTKLPLDDLAFAGKEELFSPAMKAAGMDEALLLYIDDELPAAEKAVVANRIETDKAYALQHSLLVQTKLNADETISYPDKNELYRHERKAMPFLFWMRIAAAVILLLLGMWFFFLNKGKQPNDDSLAGRHQPVKNNPVVNNRPAAAEEMAPKKTVLKEDLALRDGGMSKPLVKDIKATKQKVRSNGQDNASANEEAVANNHRDVVRLEAVRFTTKLTITPGVGINETVTHRSVTSQQDSSYNKQNSPINNPEVAWAVNEKKTPARGFFRKVSRFIERKAGIGTVNADNELLIGAVAVKLK